MATIPTVIDDTGLTEYEVDHQKYLHVLFMIVKILENLDVSIPQESRKPSMLLTQWFYLFMMKNVNYSLIYSLLDPMRSRTSRYLLTILVLTPWQIR